MTKKKDEVQAKPEEVTENEKLPAEAESVEPEIVDAEEEKLINDTVEFINKVDSEIKEEATTVAYKGAIKIGKFILEKFYDNNIKNALSKTPTKKVSFNKLCEREDLAVSPHGLARMVKVACQEQVLIDNKVKVESEHFTYTHRSLLFKQNDTDKKVKLANDCIKNEWSTRQFEEEIKNTLKVKDKKERKKSLVVTSRQYNEKIKEVVNIFDSSNFSFNYDDCEAIKNKDSLVKTKNNLQELKDNIEKIKKAKLTTISKECTKLITELEKIEADMTAKAKEDEKQS